MDPATAKMSLLGKQSSAGDSPCHVSVVEGSGGAFPPWLLVANYGDKSGGVAVLPIQPGGSLGAATDSKVRGPLQHGGLLARARDGLEVPAT